MNILNLTLIQTSLVWEDKQSNLDNFDNQLKDIKTDLIILPEMFTTGFSMNTNLSEDMSGNTIKWMTDKSNDLNCAICGSFICQEDGRFYNRLVWIEPNRLPQFYDKRHLFSNAGEDQYYTPGQQRLLIEYKGWKILPLICYDLRFPVWARNIENYDILLYIANWPKSRQHAWRTLLQSRAIENQSYVIGVNRVGEDGLGKLYSGNSMVVDFSGQILFERENDFVIHQHQLDRSQLELFRTEFPFLRDKDKFELI